MHSSFLHFVWRGAAPSIFAVIVAVSPAPAGDIQRSASFGDATMSFDGDLLDVSTGVVSRQWKLTKQGLATTGLRFGSMDFSNLAATSRDDCDWSLGDLIEAELVAVTAARHNDDSFTGDHLQVIAEFEYPVERLRVRYVVWAYPGAAGLRTQLQVAGLPGFESSKRDWTSQRVETIYPFKASHRRLGFGLMQGIKTNMNVPLLAEKVITGKQASVDWANGVALQAANRGLILVKESNKHTAMKADADVATGGFEFAADRVAVTGAGLYPADVSTDRFRSCWATWLVMYRGDESDGELALKQFDRRRYPVRPDRDIYIMANTWGSEDMRPECLHSAREEAVLAELKSVADLGIDVLQIDDGWQTPQWTTAASAKQVQRGREAYEVFGDYPVYPEGWSRVRQTADELGVTLGLWAAWTAPLEALKSNYDEGDFKYFKLDFAHLNSKDKYDDLTDKARQLIKHSGHTASVNWDVTEVATRMGYFSGREYGNIYLANRKTKTVRNPVLYVPHKVLRDAWHLSKYTNLNKFQVTVQNIDIVQEDAPTDAAMHPHDYVTAIALMSSPIFFQETRYYSPEARAQVRDLLTLYKQHRRAMYEGYVFPIGNEPDNLSWTGFQNHRPQAGTGYLMIFRERLNRSSDGELQLRFVDGATLNIVNLVTGKSWPVSVDSDGKVKFSIDEAPGFLFLQYEAL